MIKYGLKEFVNNIYSNIFIAIQLAVTLVIAIARVSSVLSRTEFYTPVKNIINQEKGFFILSADDQAIFSDGISKEKSIDKIISPYTVNYLHYNFEDQYIKDKNYEYIYSEKPNYITCLSDEFANIYKPEMLDGKWITDYRPKNNNEIYGVITENTIYKLNDTITAVTTKIKGKADPKDEFYDEEDPYVYEYVPIKIKIVGVVKEKAKIFGLSPRNTTYSAHTINFNDLYSTFDKEDTDNTKLILSENVVKNLGLDYYYSDKYIIKLKDNISDNEMSEIEMNMKNNAAGELTPLNELMSNSLDYVNGELIKLLPIFICALILVIVSSVSISALNTKKKMRYYGIMYVCGSRWKSCLIINLINSILTIIMSVIITVLAFNIFKYTSLLENNIFNFGNIQIIVCMIILLINLIFSFIMPLIIMSHNTPKEILSSNE